MTRILFFSLAVLVARVASAHNVPIFPSVCTPEPLEVTVPSRGQRALADPGGAADQLRISYDAGASLVQLCPADPAMPVQRCGAPAPRALSGLGPGATLAFPEVFSATLLANGDLRTAALPLVLTIAGVPYTVPVTFTTGPAALGDTVANDPGAPIGADGHFALLGTGVLAGLPEPLADQGVFVRFDCTATPAPDVDQFHVAPRITKLGGTINRLGITLKATLEVGGTAADFTRPAVFEVRAGEQVLGTFTLPAGLAARGRKAFAGENASGQKTLLVRRVKTKPIARYSLKLRLAQAVDHLPVGGSAIDLSCDVGGMVSRASRPFRATHGGSVLKAG